MASLLFCLHFHKGLLLKERICSSRSKFFPLGVDSYIKELHHLMKQQEIMQVNITLFSEKRQDTFIRAVVFNRINMVVNLLRFEYIFRRILYFMFSGCQTAPEGLQSNF